MLQASLKALLRQREGWGEGSLSLLPSTSTARETPPQPKAVVKAAVDVGGFGGAGASRPARIWFWHELFRHINASWARINGADYTWRNADRKILANMARKYGVPAVMAMWDLYAQLPGRWHQATGGSVYGLARDGARLRDIPRYKALADTYQRQLDQAAGLAAPADVLESLGLVPKLIK